MPRIEDFRFFCDVVESGSFSKAAEKIGVSQPAISQQIKALETEYGVKLLHREGNEIVPTEDGKVIYSYAAQIIAFFEHSKDLVSQNKDILLGDLIIGASSGPGENILPSILGKFKQINPDVNIFLKVADTGEILNGIVNHRMELGFVGSTRRDAQLIFEPFINDELVLVTSKCHPLAKKSHIQCEELLQIPLILQQQGSGATSVLFQVLNEQGIRPSDLKHFMELGLQESTKTAVKAGLGATIISKFGVQDELLRGELVQISIQDISLKRNFYVCYNRTLPLSNLINNFLLFAHQNKKNLFAPPQHTS
jgi:DNA-binding transcriptional LysR family regulator